MTPAFIVDLNCSLSCLTFYYQYVMFLLFLLNFWIKANLLMGLQISKMLVTPKIQPMIIAKSAAIKTNELFLTLNCNCLSNPWVEIMSFMTVISFNGVQFSSLSLLLFVQFQFQGVYSFSLFMYYLLFFCACYLGVCCHLCAASFCSVYGPFYHVIFPKFV